MERCLPRRQLLDHVGGRLDDGAGAITRAGAGGDGAVVRDGQHDDARAVERGIFIG
ncbi:MAG: hypothetical protein HYX50_04575 [Chloroflexi bacterium]|nr:hypothetical protein [Chloroflexota bacterium]